MADKKKAGGRWQNGSIVPGLIVLSGILLAIVVVAVLFLSRMGLLHLPFGEEATTPVTTEKSFADELISLLPDVEDTGGAGVSLTITVDELETIVEEAAMDIDHVHRLKITYTSGVRRVQYAEVVSRGGKFRADLTDSGGLILKRMLYDTSRIQIFDGATGQSKVFSMNEWFSLSQPEDRELLTMLYGFSPKGELGLPSMADVLALLETEEIADYRIDLLRQDKEHYIYVTFRYTLTGVVEEYWLDLETGIVLRATSALNGTVYYTMETEELSFDVSEYEDGYFKIQ